MSFSKWIGASIGWSFAGPIGAIIGLALGSVVDAMANGNNSSRKRGRRAIHIDRTQSGDFEVSLLILASFVFYYKK